MNDLEAVATAARLAALGISVRSPELEETARGLSDFYARGGNRAMRRAAKKRSGAGRTLRAGGAKVRW